MNRFFKMFDIDKLWQTKDDLFDVLTFFTSFLDVKFRNLDRAVVRSSDGENLRKLLNLATVIESIFPKTILTDYRNLSLVIMANIFHKLGDWLSSHFLLMLNHEFIMFVDAK